MSTTIKIQLTRSLIRKKKKHKLTVKALGLRRIGQVVEKPFNRATLGMIKQVGHMIKIIGIYDENGRKLWPSD